MNNETSLIHKFLFAFKIIVLLRSSYDFVTSFMAQASVYRNIDLVVYALMIVTIGYSLFRHAYKRGVYGLVGYLVVSIVFNLMIFIQMRNQITNLNMSIWNWAIGAVLECFVFYLFIRRDWSKLK